MAVNLLVVGRCGNGKSSTGNSILGNKTFTTSSSNSCDHFDIKTGTTSFNDKNVTVMDISGLEYPNLDNPGDVNSQFTEIETNVRNMADGFSAVLIVLKYGLRFTNQEVKAVEMIKSTFGRNVVKDYGVIVMSYGDNFASEMEEDGRTFEVWCEEQTGEIRDLFDECDKRCLLFNNRAKDFTDQRNKLFAVLAKVPSFNSPYTVQDYEKAAGSRNTILVTSKSRQLEKEMSDLLNVISDSLDRIGQGTKSEDEVLLQGLLGKFNILKKHLQEEDKGTGILNQLHIPMSIIETRIKNKIKLAEHRIHPAEGEESFEKVDKEDCLDLSDTSNHDYTNTKETKDNPNEANDSWDFLLDVSRILNMIWSLKDWIMSYFMNDSNSSGVDIENVTDELDLETKAT